MWKISEIRSNNGITLEEAADHLGMSMSTLQHFEEHPEDIRLSDALLLADLYKVEITMLF
ncbi:helix-turn-helix transcriptional regulator [Paenibacillus sp. M1]|uniref:Helix-turn-helix transcriptional regulator n=1 Tax=Paenibacillus haidiansis TaxID=1574488 RepID=A0ABU7VS93_9BACL